MTHFTWSRECGMRGLFCLSLCAIVMKMLFISPCDESDFDETSNNGKSFESANFWARWRDTCWAPSKSILFPTISRGILSPSKCVSASWSQLGSDRNEFSLNCYFKKILWKASSRNDQTIVCLDIKIHIREVYELVWEAVRPLLWDDYTRKYMQPISESKVS